MHWKLLLLCRVVIAYIAMPLLIKLLSKRAGRKERLGICYGSAFLLALLLVLGEWNQLRFSLPIMLYGVVNGIGMYCLWRAYELNLSKSALMSLASPMIGIALGIVFLDELSLITPLLWLGIGVTMSAGLVQVLGMSMKNELGERKKHDWRVAAWMTAHIVPWSIGGFIMRYSSVTTGMPRNDFLFSFYLGMAIGAACVLFLPLKDNEQELRLSWKVVFAVVVLGGLSFSSSLLRFDILETVPVGLLQSISYSCGIIFPLLLGLFVFKELKAYSRIEKVSTVLTVIGLIIMASAKF